jgi:hypothetical protein
MILEHMPRRNTLLALYIISAVYLTIFTIIGLLMEPYGECITLLTTSPIIFRSVPMCYAYKKLEKNNANGRDFEFLSASTGCTNVVLIVIFAIISVIFFDYYYAFIISIICCAIDAIIEPYIWEIFNKLKIPHKRHIKPQKTPDIHNRTLLSTNEKTPTEKKENIILEVEGTRTINGYNYTFRHQVIRTTKAPDQDASPGEHKPTGV